MERVAFLRLLPLLPLPVSLALARAALLWRLPVVLLQRVLQEQALLQQVLSQQVLLPLALLELVWQVWQKQQASWPEQACRP